MQVSRVQTNRRWQDRIQSGLPVRVRGTDAYSAVNRDKFMKILNNPWSKTLWSNEEGQDVAEYAVMLAVMLVIVISTVRLIGSNASNVFSLVGSAIQ
jgi:Flp pilus assembly pilin Flp